MQAAVLKRVDSYLHAPLRLHKVARGQVGARGIYIYIYFFFLKTTVFHTSEVILKTGRDICCVELAALTRTGSWHVKKRSPTELRRASSDRQPMELLRRPAMARYIMAPAGEQRTQQCGGHTRPPRLGLEPGTARREVLPRPRPTTDCYARARCNRWRAGGMLLLLLLLLLLLQYGRS
jgi:hypothetical protein